MGIFVAMFLFTNCRARDESGSGEPQPSDKPNTPLTQTPVDQRDTATYETTLAEDTEFYSVYAVSGGTHYQYLVIPKIRMASGIVTYRSQSSTFELYFSTWKWRWFLGYSETNPKASQVELARNALLKKYSAKGKTFDPQTEFVATQNQIKELTSSLSWQGKVLSQIQLPFSEPSSSGMLVDGHRFMFESQPKGDAAVAAAIQTIYGQPEQIDQFELRVNFKLQSNAYGSFEGPTYLIKDMKSKLFDLPAKVTI